MTETNNNDHFKSFDQNKYEEASKSKRFTNYILDLIAKTLIYFFVLVALNIFSPTTLAKITSNKLFEYIIVFALTFTYYHLSELLTGKTIGKIITNTKVVDTNFNTPTPNAILYRSLFRLVPFDAFSFIGEESEGWHDKWSKTIVINEKENI